MVFAWPAGRGAPKRVLVPLSPGAIPGEQVDLPARSAIRPVRIGCRQQQVRRRLEPVSLPIGEKGRRVERFSSQMPGHLEVDLPTRVGSVQTQHLGP